MEFSNRAGRCSQCGGITVGGRCLSCNTGIFEDVERIIDSADSKKHASGRKNPPTITPGAFQLPINFNINVSVEKINVKL